MNERKEEFGSVLERPIESVDYAEAWSVALSTLENLLGKEACSALCFHMSERTGVAICVLMMEDPEEFKKTMISIVKSDVDPVLDKIAFNLSKEFGIGNGKLTFAQVIEELKR